MQIKISFSEIFDKGYLKEYCEKYKISYSLAKKDLEKEVYLNEEEARKYGFIK
jgi:ATP-dependent protease ClpP protease subunit